MERARSRYRNRLQRLASAILMLENQRLMVTSATSGRDNSDPGLALALVNFGFRVLVVDGDLRQAEMSRRLRYFKTESELQTCPSSYISWS